MKEDILVVALDKTHIRVIPPNDDDPDEINDMKCFILACMYRRMMDKPFTKDMQQWLDGVSIEEMREFAGGVSAH